MKTKYRVQSTEYSAFTLIELLVVISIIGILAALVLVSFTTSQRQARDTQRKSDIKQYATSLEGYANQNSSLYPSHTLVQTLSAGSNQLCTDVGISSCPGDPTSTGSHVYKYLSNGTGSGATATQYVLWDQLENSSNWWIVCSNGKSGTYPFASWTGATYDAVTNTVSCPI